MLYCEIIFIFYTLQCFWLAVLRTRSSFQIWNLWPTTKSQNDYILLSLHDYGIHTVVYIGVLRNDVLCSDCTVSIDSMSHLMVFHPYKYLVTYVQVVARNYSSFSSEVTVIVVRLLLLLVLCVEIPSATAST